MGGPLLPLLGGLGLGLALALWLDHRAAHSPAARTAARLAAMAARGQAGDIGAGAAVLDADVFNVRRRGLRGAVAGWFADTSANIGGPKAMRLLMGISIVAGVAVAVLIVSLARPALATALAAWLGATVGAFLIARGEMRRRWTIAFLDLLVEAVELLTRSVRAGYAVPAAIRMVGKEIRAPVGPVFARIADEDDLGIEMRQALRNAAQRVALPDFTFLAIAMVIQRETGGQLGDSLDNLHAVLRKRKEARLKIQALTAEGRMSANIVGAIPFVAGAGVYMLNPEQTMRLLEPGLGQTMLFGAGAMLGVGLVVVRWIVKAQP
jgi:Flp pilus assembly protein TadB